MTRRSVDSEARDSEPDDRRLPAAESSSAVVDVARSLAATWEAPGILQLAAEGALRVTRASGAFVEWISRDEAEVVCAAGRGVPSPGTRVALAESLSGSLPANAPPHSAVRVEAVKESTAPYLAALCRGCSALLLPLAADDESSGTLVLLHDAEADGFQPEEVAEALALSELTTLSLRRARRLQRSEQERAHLAALLDSTSTGIYGITPDGKCTFINAAAARMIGHAPEECLGRDMHSVVHHHHADGTYFPRHECPIHRSLQAGTGIQVDEDVLWRKDGTPITAEYTSYPIVREGQVTGAVVTFVDITEWRAAEQRYTRQLRALTDAAIDINAAPTLNEALQLITERAREVIGAHQSVTSMRVGQSSAQQIDAVSLSDRYAAWRGYDASITGSGIYRLVTETNRPMRLTQAELEAHPAWRGFGSEADRHPPMRGWLAVPLIARGGTNLGLIQLSDRYEGDFTEQDEAILVQFAQMAAAAIEKTQLYEDAQAARRAAEHAREAAETAQQDAENARAEAEAANRAKSDFLASMSHEIRTPINAIVGYTDLLDLGIAGPVNEAQQAQLDRIRTSSQHLLGLINDILDLAKIEAGRITVEHERHLVVNAVAAALSLVRPQATIQGLTVEEACAEQSSVHYVGDEDRVRQILVNLLSNAVKFTPAGGTITVSCGSTDEPDPGVDLPGEGQWTYFRVSDTGIGIGPDDLRRIFRPFVQAEGGHTRTRGGTGLGLSISRQLAVLMGGGLSAQSEPGKGSTFTLWLPCDLPVNLHIEESALVERHGDRMRPRGLVEVSEALQRAAPQVLDRFAERIRRDTRLPMAASLGEADLENHQVSLVADLAQSLAILEKSQVVPQRLLRDGSDIQRVIAELHGRQRALLGWTEEALRREYEILWEEVEAGVRQSLGVNPDANASSGLELLRHFMEHAEQISLRSLRRAKSLEVS